MRGGAQRSALGDPHADPRDLVIAVVIAWHGCEVFGSLDLMLRSGPLAAAQSFVEAGIDPSFDAKTLAIYAKIGAAPPEERRSTSAVGVTRSIAPATWIIQRRVAPFTSTHAWRAGFAGRAYMSGGLPNT